MIRPPETSHVAESNARVDTVGQEQGRSLYSMAKSLASKPPVTQRHQPQPPRKDRFDRPPPRSIVISPPPRTNVFAGLGKKIRKPLAEKDQNMEGSPVRTVKPLLSSHADIVVESCYGQDEH